MSQIQSQFEAAPAGEAPAGGTGVGGTVVLKFGGSVLRGEEDLARASAEIGSWIKRGFRVVAVVSAFEGETDRLVKQAKGYERAGVAQGDCASRALLTATGELTSASLLGLALTRAGIASTVAPPWTILLRATGDALDGFPVSVSKPIIDGLLSRHQAIVVPGFVGLDSVERLILLGRGGSDLSALFIAERIGAQVCRLVKDVDGLYEYDPADEAVASGAKKPPRRYARLPWDEALRLDGGIVQHKAVRFAKERSLRFEVGTFGTSEPSVVGDEDVLFSVAAPAAAAACS